MGFESKISHNTYPRQGKLQGKTVSVYFHYDTDRAIRGVCIRDDAEKPYQTIFELLDGRIVLASECQFEAVGEVAA